ncbi:MAG: nucleotidyltransferase domain-containing protein [Candidatus Staskawiczbacteria bacterium]|nr:nucleotidyltransferase domain-containing protein [Candidatus Staskawiczbacteria bacterium]
MEISEKQKQKIEGVAKEYNLKLILLFGSQATGKTHKESDFDVAYLPEKNLSFDDEVDINFQFINIFGHDRVDTVDIRKAPPLLLFGIFRECLILYKKDDLIFPTYRAYAYKKYIEAKPFLEKRFKKLSERIKKL